MAIVRNEVFEIPQKGYGRLILNDKRTENVAGLCTIGLNGCAGIILIGKKNKVVQEIYLMHADPLTKIYRTHENDPDSCLNTWIENLAKQGCDEIKIYHDEFYDTKYHDKNFKKFKKIKNQLKNVNISLVHVRMREKDEIIAGCIAYVRLPESFKERKYNIVDDNVLILSAMDAEELQERMEELKLELVKCYLGQFIKDFDFFIDFLTKRYGEETKLAPFLTFDSNENGSLLLTKEDVDKAFRLSKEARKEYDEMVIRRDRDLTPTTTPSTPTEASASQLATSTPVTHEIKQQPAQSAFFKRAQKKDDNTKGYSIETIQPLSKENPKSTLFPKIETTSIPKAQPFLLPPITKKTEPSKVTINKLPDNPSTRSTLLPPIKKTTLPTQELPPKPFKK